MLADPLDPDIVATGGKAYLPSAVFPDGLPEGLEVAVARQPISEGLSDSDRGPPRVSIVILSIVLTCPIR